MWQFLSGVQEKMIHITIQDRRQLSCHKLQFVIILVLQAVCHILVPILSLKSATGLIKTYKDRKLAMAM